jgi:chromosome partitioning protein
MGSLCRSLQIRPGDLALSDLLVGLDGELGQLIRRTEIPNLYCIPGDPNLRSFEMEHGGSLAYREALRDKLEGVLKWKRFPFVILDCPPSLGLLSGNALAASTDVIVPVDGSAYGMVALVDTLRVLKLVRQNLNQQLSITGLLLNNVNMGTLYDKTVREVMERQFKGLLFRSVIPNSPEADVSSQLGQPVVRYAPESWMAKAYRQLIEELLAREPRHVE